MQDCKPPQLAAHKCCNFGNNVELEANFKISKTRINWANKQKQQKHVMMSMQIGETDLGVRRNARGAKKENGDISGMDGWMDGWMDLPCLCPSDYLIWYCADR